MLRVWRLSGEQLASVPTEELTDGKALKRHLQVQCGLSRFRQELLHNGTVLNDETSLQSPLDLQLVLLPFSSTSQPQADKFAAAAASGHDLQVEQFLQQRQDPNVFDNALGLSALYVAAMYGQVPVVRLLLEARADVKRGTRRNDNTPLAVAARYGWLEVVDLLLRARADKNVRNDRGETPLWVASQRGRAEVVRMLLQARVAMDQGDNSGETPLCVACRNGREETVCVLREAGADMLRPNNRGETPLSLAAQRQRAGTFFLLLCCWRPALAMLRLAWLQESHSSPDSSAAD